MAIRISEELPAGFVITGSLAVIGAVGLADYATGVEIRIFPLYFLPVAFCAWYASARWAWVLSVASACSWVAANLLAGKEYSSVLVWSVNFSVQAIAFATVGQLISTLRSRLLLEAEMSRSDPLTHLLNRRGFEEHATLLLAHARRQRTPATLAYLDLDDFKRVNDRMGHRAGDGVLRTVAGALANDIREGDLAARVGGDEFLLLLPGAGVDEATSLLERLHQALCDSLRDHGWPVTVSVGAMSFARPPMSLQEMVSRSDACMYRAKQGGKNRVCVEAAQPDDASRAREAVTLGPDTDP